MKENIRERVEDAMVHFDDSGYQWHQFFIFGFGEDITQYRVGLSDILKTENSNEPINLNVCIRVTILKKSAVITFGDWNEYNSNLRTAIMRMNRKGGNVSVQSSGTQDTIVIGMGSYKVRNLKLLSDYIREFNREWSFQSLTVSLKYHPETGIGIYIMEQKNKNPRGYFFQKHMDGSFSKVKKREWFINPSTFEKEWYDVETKAPSLKGILDYFKIVDKFDKNEDAFRENPYLSSVETNIMARVVPKSFSIC